MQRAVGLGAILTLNKVGLCLFFLLKAKAGFLPKNRGHKRILILRGDV